MKLWEKISFRRKVFAGMVLVAGIPTLVGYLVMLQVFNVTYQNKLKQEAETILNATVGSLDSAFLHIYDELQLLAASDIIKENLSSGETDNSEVYRQLYQATGEYGNYAHFSLYDAGGNKVLSVADNSYIKNKLPLDWGLLYEAAGTPEECVVRNARIYKGENRVEYLRIAKAVQGEEGEIQGYVIAVVNNGMFDDMLHGIVNENQGSIYAMDDFQEMVYCSLDSYDEDEMRLVRREFLGQRGEMQESTKLYEGEDGKYFYYLQYAKESRLYLFYQQPIAILTNIKNSVVIIAILSGMLGIGICICLSGSVSSIIYQPIKRMQTAITEIQQGNFNARIEVDCKDELGQLSESFNIMAAHLEENMQCLVLRERELNEAHVKMMQAQLNPHFLYNTLDTMKWLGKANEIPEIATLSAGLAKILRMSISAKTKVSLRQELEFAEAYVQIQKIRFEDKFEYIVDVSEEAKDCLVPKLILQPIIENSIIHGFAENTEGIVMVQAACVRELEEEQLQIIVSDNGAGMSEEQLMKLNSKEQVTERKERRIGFYNVNEIIRLNYGEVYGLKAESCEGKGTKVLMTMPVKRGEE